MQVLTGNLLTVLVLAFSLCLPSKGAAQELNRMLIGVPTNSVAWFPLHVALKKGIFHEYKLAPQPVLMDARVAVAALGAKEIPYVAHTGSVVSAAGRGFPMKVIMLLASKAHFALVVAPEITSPQALRGRAVGISRPGASPHRALIAILEKFKVDPREVKILGLGPDRNRVLGLRNKQVDAIITGVPYDLMAEKDGFRPLVYIKDVMDIPLSGLAAHDDRIREKPEEIRNVILGILKGIAYTKTHREEVLPLLKDFVGLESLETARKAYDRIKDNWPDDGMPSEEGLRNLIMLADIPPAVPVNEIVNWAPLKQAVAALKR